MTCRESYTIEKHALLVFISAFLSPYDELFNIKQNFKMKKYMPLNGLRWSRDSGSTLCGTPPNGVLGQAGGGVRYTDYKLCLHNHFYLHIMSTSSAFIRVKRKYL